MSKLVMQAAVSSDAIITEVAAAVRALAYTTNPSGDHGVLIDPAGQLAKLRAAQQHIEKAIAIHEGTRWPSRQTVARAVILS